MKVNKSIVMICLLAILFSSCVGSNENSDSKEDDLIVSKVADVPNSESGIIITSIDEVVKMLDLENFDNNQD